MYYLGWLIVVFNVAGIILTAVDKHRALRHRWRIPEKTFFLLAAAGGSIGVYAGCLLFRHKTRHPRFMIGLPAILILQAVLVIYWIYLNLDPASK